MSDQDSIGLNELIKHVKKELLSTETDGDGLAPFFSVDAVTLELQVTIRKDAKAGLKVYVADLGGGLARDDTQKVTVTLSPLIEKAARLRLYKAQYPDRWKEVERAAVKGGARR